MAVEADCGSSTVLEEFRVTTAVGFLVRGECQCHTLATARHRARQGHGVAQREKPGGRE